MRPRTVLAVALAVLAFAPAAAATLSFAPLDQPGAMLTVPESKLSAALTCSPGVDHAARAPVMLIPGTGANVKDNYSWTYEPALDKLKIPWCGLDLPQHGTSDIQIAGEYVVYAIRTMYARAGRRIAIIGHSQGGMIGRWALRFWPDTRSMVDDVIAFAPSNHGTTTAESSCKQKCSAADWQQSDKSVFIAALNSFAETFAGISYTDVYTHTDEVVRPNTNDQGSSSLHTGHGQITNVAVQDICPADTSEHLSLGTVDAVAYVLAVDALEHPGPADPGRIKRSVCAQPLQPGVDPATFPQNAGAALLDFIAFTGVDVPAEPALACYAYAGYPPTVKLAVTIAQPRVNQGRWVRLRVTVRAGSGSLAGGAPVAGAIVSFHRVHARTNQHGVAVLPRLHFVKTGARPLAASASGYLGGATTFRVLRART